MSVKKQPPKQITITSCNIKVEPSAKQQAQLELAKAMGILAASLNVEDRIYGVYIEGDKHECK